ncbi:MAG: GGDEF domain-containing protein [Clostridiales bacterium]|nr:GGDEF domain-containing protein [Clostridiales bacterium]
MYYSSVAIISLIVHLIINNEALKKVEKTSDNLIRLKFRNYLLVLIVFYIADAIWGFFYDQKWVIPTYIDTCVFFLSMAVSVLLWTIAVVAFTENKGIFGKILVGCGVFILAFQAGILIANLFVPIVFSFNAEKEYLALPARHIALLMQMVLFLATAFYAFIISAHSDGEKRRHYRTVGFSSVIMAIFILLQMFYPLMPFYSLGCLFGTCMIHAFIYKEKDMEYGIKMEAANQKAYKDGLTGVKNKLAYLEALAELEINLENGTLKEYGVVVFDINGLKQINDTLGHEAGDEYIKSACTLICTQFDHSPVFRIGGDEFVAILKGSDYEKREELEGSFRKTIDENQRNGHVVVSSGLAVYQPDNDESFNDVFIRADQLMYERKQALKIRS